MCRALYKPCLAPDVCGLCALLRRLQVTWTTGLRGVGTHGAGRGRWLGRAAPRYERHCTHRTCTLLALRHSWCMAMHSRARSTQHTAAGSSPSYVEALSRNPWCVDLCRWSCGVIGRLERLKPSSSRCAEHCTSHALRLMCAVCVCAAAQVASYVDHRATWSWDPRCRTRPVAPESSFQVRAALCTPHLHSACTVALKRRMAMHSRARSTQRTAAGSAKLRRGSVT